MKYIKVNIIFISISINVQKLSPLVAKIQVCYISSKNCSKRFPIGWAYLL